MSFDPNPHLSKIKGAEYLEVKWRLVWLRDRHPDASIQTECLHFDGENAAFRCTITIPGGGSATGHKQESIKHFTDPYEKAETGAIGRACAALGFGTQFCDDFLSGERIVDSPVNSPSRTTKASRPSIVAAAPLPDALPNASLSRAELLAKLKTEQDRIGVDALLVFLQEQIGKTTKSEMTDPELRRILEWTKEQPAVAA